MHSIRLFIAFLCVLSLCAAFRPAVARAVVGESARSAVPKDKKKKKDAVADPVQPVAESSPSVANVEPQTPAEAEHDPQRTAWRIDVAPFRTIGSGHPGKAAADFDKPDGLAFTRAGLLLATDAKNRRVQVWDPRTGTRVGEFGKKVFGGEIVDIAEAPDGRVFVTDQTLNLAYVFAPPKAGAVDKETGKPVGPADYQFKGTAFGEQGFDKLGGIAVDSRGRIYCVDAHLNDVRRFTPDLHVDASWRFEKTAPGGDTYLHGCEGIAVDETSGNLYVASEKDAIVRVFDAETGAYRHKIVGAAVDAHDAPVGKHVFSGSVEGLAISGSYLFAVDESIGHVQIFDLSAPDAFNTDFEKLSAAHTGLQAGYVGFVGHAPLVDFEDKSNETLQQQLKDESIIPGQANPPGYFCSPDSVTTFVDPATHETYIAVADQCNFRLAVYRLSDLTRAGTVGHAADVAHHDAEDPATDKNGTPDAKKNGKKSGKKAHKKPGD